MKNKFYVFYTIFETFKSQDYAQVDQKICACTQW